MRLGSWKPLLSERFAYFLAQPNLGRMKSAICLLFTMGEFCESGVRINNQWWWDIVEENGFNPHDVVKNYETVTNKYGVGHRTFQEFADWCKRKP